jgi:hypothetical protein
MSKKVQSEAAWVRGRKTGETRAPLAAVTSRVIVKGGRGRWLAAGLLLASVTAGAPVRAQGKSAPAVEATPAPAPAPQGAPAATDPDKEADKLYWEGLKAIQAKEWEKARVALLEAFKRKPMDRTAASLGRAEMMAGKPRDAAEHLSFFLREAKDAKPTVRQAAEKMLAEAKAKIGTVTIKVDAEGAEVLIDGQTVGTSPLAEPVFVEPGSRTFEAKKEGRPPASQGVEVAAGSAPVVDLQLPPAPLPTIEPTRPNEAGLEWPAGTARPKWWPWALLGGAGVSVVGLSLGVGFSAGAVAKNKAALEERDWLVVRTEVGHSICPAQEPNQTAKQASCDKMADLAGTRDTYRNVAIAGWVIGGVAAAGTVAAVLWKPRWAGLRIGRASGLVVVPSAGGVLAAGRF